MGGDQARQVVEHQLGHLVGQLVADPGVADQDIVDRHRRHVLLLAVVGAGGNARGVVGRAVDLRHHVRRDRDEGDRHGRGQVADGRHAQAGGLQRSVELAVLDQLHRLGVGQVLHLAHVLVAQAGGLEDRPGVQLGTALGRAHRNALAFQVGQGLDARGLAGHYLDIVRIGIADSPQLLQRRLEAGVGDPVPGVGDRVAQRQRQFSTPGLQQVEVLDRSLGGLHRGFRALDIVPVDLREADPYGVIDPAGAAGEDIDEGRRGKDHGTEGHRCGKREKTEASAQRHGKSPVLIVVVALSRKRPGFLRPRRTSCRLDRPATQDNQQGPIARPAPQGSRSPAFRRTGRAATRAARGSHPRGGEWRGSGAG